MWSSLGRVNPPISSFSQLPVAHSAGLNHHGLFFYLQWHVYQCFIIAQFTFWQPCWWDIMGIASDISVRFNLTENPLILLLLHSFHPSSTVFLEPYVWHCFFNVSFVIWLHNYAFWLIMVVWSFLCYKECSTMKSDGDSYFCEKVNIYRLLIISKLVVVDSHLVPWLH